MEFFGGRGILPADTLVQILDPSQTPKVRLLETTALDVNHNTQNLVDALHGSLAFPPATGESTS